MTAIPFSVYVRKHPAFTLCKNCDHRIVFNTETGTWRHTHKTNDCTCIIAMPKRVENIKGNVDNLMYNVFATTKSYEHALHSRKPLTTHKATRDGDLQCKSSCVGKAMYVYLPYAPVQCKACFRKRRHKK